MVTLSLGLDDFIAPSLACVKPIQIDPSKPNRVISFEAGENEPVREEARATAKVTLNDCLACSGCVTSAETVLVEQQSVSEFLRHVATGEAQLVVCSISPVARAALAAHAGIGVLEAFGRLSGFFRRLGCHHVFDCGMASDLCLQQAGLEFVQRFRAHAEERRASPLPVLSSSCPGWVCYAEKVQGAAVLPLLSRVKSPQQVAGSLLKYGFAAAQRVPPERTYHVSVMPCFDKKLEASRDDFFNPAAGAEGTRDVDCVLSSAEVAKLLEERGETLQATEAAPLDGAHASGLCALSAPDRLTYSSPGGSGGLAAHVFRAAALELFGVAIPAAEPLQWKAGRNKDIRELSLEVGGATVLRFAQAFGFRNIQNVVRRAKAGGSPYHYVELMACPGGCANGGGQPRVASKLPQDAAARVEHIERLMVSEAEGELRPALDNPRLAALYQPGGLLEGGPLGERAQRYLTTQYHAVEASTQNAMTIQW